MFTRKDPVFERDLPETSTIVTNTTKRFGNVVVGHRTA